VSSGNGIDNGFDSFGPAAHAVIGDGSFGTPAIVLQEVVPNGKTKKSKRSKNKKHKSMI